MKLLAIVCLLAASALGAPADNDQALLGTWRLDMTQGRLSVIGFTTYRADHKCIQLAKVSNEGAEQWIFIVSDWGDLPAGIWQEVVHSSDPKILPGQRTQEKILELTDKHIIYVENGEKTEEIREDMPPEFKQKLKEYLKG